jgi:hypothetical protein
MFVTISYAVGVKKRNCREIEQIKIATVHKKRFFYETIVRTGYLSVLPNTHIFRTTTEKNVNGVR